MASLKFYLLPADQCAKALELHALAKEDALSAKRELLSKYGADAILRSGAHVEALAWRDKPIAMTGFTVPKFDSRQGVWLQKPKKNTLRGKQAAQEMDEVGELLEIWQWSLERALGVHGSVFGYYHGSRVFLNAVARPLEDGRVVLSMPMRDKQDSERSSGADPVAPPFAVEISEVEAERMVGEPIARIHGGKLVSHYIAVDQSGLICGLGPTHEAAIADANQQSGYPDGIMTTADGEVTLRWTTYEASPALAATVEAHGGDLPWTWTRVGGARRACLPRERQ